MRNPTRNLLLGSTVIACAGMISCGAVKTMGESSVAAVKKVGSATGAGISKVAETAKAPADAIAGLMPGPKVKVVDVREKDLKELPTGKERAIAYERERQRLFWVFSAPVRFEEPALPEPGSEMDGSLLPPRQN
jgi:hypothetical protein